MKPDTLVILSPGFPANEADSSCLPPIQSFVRSLKKEFPSLQVIVLALQYPFTAGEYDWNDCRVIAMGGRGRSKLFRLMLWQRTWKKLKAITASNNCIGVLSFWCGEAALIGHRFGRKYKLRHYCWIQGQDAKPDNRYVKRIKPFGGELIAISDFAQREFEKNHALKPQHVIPFGIDDTDLVTENFNREIDILAAGSLIPLKRYDLFIEIIKEAKKQYPGIKAVLCGKGPEEEHLKKLIEKYGLQENISMKGELPRPEVLYYMKRSRIFLHTSGYEGFGFVCIEALAAGMQVISFCKPMDADIPGWHIVQTKEGMQQKLMELLQDGSLVHEPVIPYTMPETVSKLAHLFGL